MKTLPGLLGAVVAHFVLSSCASDPYDQYPEGTVVASVPSGCAGAYHHGIDYWHCGGLYYRYWPSYGYVIVRPPHNRPPYTRPPERPVHRPPGTKPPDRPITRPPGTNPPPVRPITRPEGPSIQPVSPTMPGGGGWRGSMPRSMPRGGRR